MLSFSFLMTIVFSIFSFFDIFVVSIPKDDSIESKRRRPLKTNAVNYKQRRSEKNDFDDTKHNKTKQRKTKQNKEPKDFLKETATIL